MKGIILLLAGLSICSVPLFAGDVLFNEETALGLRVVFSEAVTIASFGDVFTTATPQGRSTEFFFGGAELAPWVGHWLNWEPASATLDAVEWLSYDPLVTDVEELPFWQRNPNPTYEEIMAAIAEYPGPDEPLYEPEPDEAIWLTDLEGHAEIYDNDSIRINYADWFDQSQITKIEVYRNGVRMRFLPDLFDVLTNEQMKTFDGSPAEHSPASSHTDHAIFGYEYRFRISLEQAPRIELGKLIESPFTVSGDYRSANLAHSWFKAVAEDWMTDYAAQAFIKGLGNLGFSSVHFTVNVFAPDDHSAEFFPQHTPDPRVADQWMLTARDKDIVDLLEWIEDAGLGADMGLQFWISEDDPTSSPESRSFVEPSDVDAWFSEYTKQVLHYAGLAEQGGAEIFRPAVEFNTMQKHTEHMYQLLDSAGSVFSGKLMVAESTHHHVYDLADFWFGSFWCHPDVVLGLNCWEATMENQADQRLSHMVERFVSEWHGVIADYRRQYPATPIVFSEIGWWYNFDGYSLGRDAVPTSVRDDQEMADVWATYLIATEFFHLDGISVWTMELAHPYARLGSACINESMALLVVSSLLGGTPTQYLPMNKLAQPPVDERTSTEPRLGRLQEVGAFAVRTDGAIDATWMSGTTFSDPVGDASQSSGDIEAIYVFSDEVNLYVGVETVGDPPSAEEVDYYLYFFPLDRRGSIAPYGSHTARSVSAYEAAFDVLPDRNVGVLPFAVGEIVEFVVPLNWLDDPDEVYFQVRIVPKGESLSKKIDETKKLVYTIE